MVGPMFRGFYRDLPEAKHLFDIDQMVREARAFDYGTMPPEVVADELDAVVLPGLREGGRKSRPARARSRRSGIVPVTRS